MAAPVNPQIAPPPALPLPPPPAGAWTGAQYQPYNPGSTARGRGEGVGGMLVVSGLISIALGLAVFAEGVHGGYPTSGFSVLIGIIIVASGSFRLIRGLRR